MALHNRLNLLNCVSEVVNYYFTTSESFITAEYTVQNMLLLNRIMLWLMLPVYESMSAIVPETS